MKEDASRADEQAAKRAAALLDDFIPLLYRTVFRHPKTGSAQGAGGHAPFKVLGVLSHVGPQSLTELSLKCGMAKANLSPLAERLVREGALERVGDPRDRRVVRFSITAEGARILKAGREASASRLRATLERLEPVDRKRLADALETVVELLEKTYVEERHAE